MAICGPTRSQPIAAIAYLSGLSIRRAHPHRRAAHKEVGPFHLRCRRGVHECVAQAWKQKKFSPVPDNGRKGMQTSCVSPIVLLPGLGPCGADCRQ